MNNWENITLGEFIDVITDYHANGAYEKLKENIVLKYHPDYAVMIRTQNFESDDFTNNLIYLNESEYNFLSKSKVKPFDIIMNKIANPGSVYLMPEISKPVSLAMNLFLIRINHRLDQKFMFYLMKYNENYIKRFANGTTTKTITKDAVRGLRFRVPPYCLQKRIASVLFTLDKKIAINKRINSELEAMAKTLYDYWFVQYDFPNERGKPYRSSGGKMEYNDLLKRDIPGGWEVKSLGGIVKFNRGISYKSSDISEKGTPMINLNSFYLNGNYKVDGIKYFNNNYSDSKVLFTGDLMIATTDVTRSADIIGKSFLIPDIFETQVIASCDIAKVEVDDIYKNYLNFLFNSGYYHQYIKGFASGTLVLHLNTDGINWFTTELPDKNILIKFNSVIKSIQQKKAMTIKQNQRLLSLREWILPMLMNGQVKVLDAFEKMEGTAAI